MLLTVAAAGLSLSDSQIYIPPGSLTQHLPISSLIGRSHNPRLAFSFVEAQMSRQVLGQLLQSSYPQLSPGVLQQLAGGQSQVTQLRTLLQGSYRRVVQPIYQGLLPYYLYNRGG